MESRTSCAACQLSKSEQSYGSLSFPLGVGVTTGVSVVSVCVDVAVGVAVSVAVVASVVVGATVGVRSGVLLASVPTGVPVRFPVSVVCTGETVLIGVPVVVCVGVTDGSADPDCVFAAVEVAVWSASFVDV